jgi:hypothetical protein
MKDYLITCIIVCGCFIVSCSQQSSEASNVNIAAADTTLKAGQQKETTAQADLGAYADLVPVELIDAESKNVYEKYGLEFAGNCYDCDLAAVSISKKYFDISNVCDEKNIYRIEHFTYEAIAGKLVIKAGKTEFVFTRIETAPVYALTIKGDSLSLKNKRFSKYYTQKKVLPKFKQHDCGDFEG